MARRRRQPSVIEIAFVENWKVSAALAAVISLAVFIVEPWLPVSTNPYLKVAAIAVKPLGLILAGLFGSIAAFKLFVQIKRGRRSTSNTRSGNFAAMRAMEKTWRPPDIGRTVVPLHERPDVWSLEFLQSLEWKRFKDLCAAYYEEKGMHVAATLLGTAGGIDIKLYQDNTSSPAATLQCKAWNGRAIGVKEVREFLGVMSREKIDKGFYMTSGGYTQEAVTFARANRITLVTGEMLLMMIARLPESSRKKLMTLASAGDYTTPTCPSCAIKMVQRSGRRGAFWRCKNFPRCRQRLYSKKQETG